MSVYFDASALVPLFVRESSSDRINALLDRLASRIHVSDFGIAEVSSAISRRVREGKDSEATANATLAALDEWLPEVTIILPIEPADVRRAGALVRNFELKLLTPDAIHLAICERSRLALVTLDNRLADAANALDVRRISP